MKTTEALNTLGFDKDSNGTVIGRKSFPSGYTILLEADLPGTSIHDENVQLKSLVEDPEGLVVFDTEKTHRNIQEFFSYFHESYILKEDIDSLKDTLQHYDHPDSQIKESIEKVINLLTTKITL